MAKNRKRQRSVDTDNSADSDDEDDGLFDVSTTRPDKPKMVTTAVQFNAPQTEYLTGLAKEKGTSRANFIRQCVVYCCNQMAQRGKIDEGFPV